MNKVKFWVIGLGIVAAMIYLIGSGIEATGVRYVKVKEIHRVDLSEYDQTVKTTGKVRAGTLRYEASRPRLTFDLEGPEGETVQVVYDGIKPDALTEDGHVIVEGRYDSSRDRIRAHTLLAKCPSRYQSRFKEADTVKE